MTRQCGDCQLCCKLLPVRSMHKPAGKKCEYQKHHKGCSVYGALLKIAPECKIWSCMWLVGKDATGELQRPDRAHYVIDTTPDTVNMRNNATGEITVRPAIQIWCDPDYPTAYEDPALLNILTRLYNTSGILPLIRFDERKAITLLPPELSGFKDEWVVVDSSYKKPDPPDIPAEDLEAIRKIKAISIVMENKS